jgi:MYXO-CTERM domain-containing protein
VRTALPASAGALFVVALLLASPASANGRFPQSNQLLFSSSDSRLVVLRTTFGVLFSHDGGVTWSWLCEDAIGLPPTSSDDPSLGLTANETIVAGIYKGLEVSPDLGCTWSFVGGGLNQQLVADLAVRPNTPAAVVAVTSTYDPDAGVEGGAGYSSRVYQSTDNGGTWSALGTPIDPTVIVTTIDVAASDPQRLYVSGFRVATQPNATNTPVLFVSTNAGSTWTERTTVPPLEHEVAVYIAAVDPTNADLVYLRTEGSATDMQSQSRLFVTSDAGQSFQIPLVSSGAIFGFALSPDGSKVYAGGAQDGLFVAQRAGLAMPNPFHKTSAIHVQCLATRGTELWACSDEASGFIAGVSTDDGATFTAKLHLTGIQAPLACAADATAAQCSGASFDQLCENLGGCASGDAAVDAASGGGSEGGTSEGGADAGGSVPPTGKTPASSGGCSVAGGGGAAGAFVALGITAIARKRRRSRSRP